MGTQHKPPPLLSISEEIKGLLLSLTAKQKQALLYKVQLMVKGNLMEKERSKKG